MKELDQAKRLVVLQADLHRHLLQLEAVALRERLAGLGAARATLKSPRPLLVAAGVVAGLLALRKGRALARWMRTAFTAWRWLRRFTAE
ncbi:MAG: hypothetical protein HZA90_07460 [Verrucomicrobia bacterium]|nr:hypothetical protein [Verrucomicrobiota bacterium]